MSDPDDCVSSPALHAVLRAPLPTFEHAVDRDRIATRRAAPDDHRAAANLGGVLEHRRGRAVRADGLKNPKVAARSTPHLNDAMVLAINDKVVADRRACVSRSDDELLADDGCKKS